ncbi:hypothetical protein TRVL_06400 [Trypanosoma vivax]|nr:hypothetical protein TRVL_06400 [Trypanosoma vivax]
MTVVLLSTCSADSVSGRSGICLESPTSALSTSNAFFAANTSHQSSLLPRLGSCLNVYSHWICVSSLFPTGTSPRTKSERVSFDPMASVASPFSVTLGELSLTLRPSRALIATLVESHRSLTDHRALLRVI